MNRGLLNWLLCDYIKSVRARKEKGGRRSGAQALSIYNCFLTHWPNSAVPGSERRWLTAVRVGGHCRSFRAFGFHSDPSLKAIYCILKIPEVHTLLNYNYYSHPEHCLSTANSPIHPAEQLFSLFLPLICFSIFLKWSPLAGEKIKGENLAFWWIIDEWPHLRAWLQRGSRGKRWG